MPNLGAGEWLIILLVIVILFGSAKLPSLARSLGRSMRILKSETKGLHTDDDEAPAGQQTQQAGQQQAGQQQAGQQQAGQQQAGQQQGQLPPGAQDDGTTLNGVPLSEAERARRNS